MVDLEKLKLKIRIKEIICLIFFIFMISCVNNIETYSYWYEEPIIGETKKASDYWWLSKKKQEEAIEKDRLENEERIKNFDKRTKWIYSVSDLTKFPKSKWEIIDEDNDLIGYNYYFDKDGYLLKDTITPDYKVVDSKGREVDLDFRPIKYYITSNIVDSEEGIVLDKADTYETTTRAPASILIGVGVTLKEKTKIYDNSVDKYVLDYVESSNRFLKNVKGTTANKVKWKDCASLKNEGYIIVTNPKNNFNKISTWISNEYITDSNNVFAAIDVYDADEYEKYKTNHVLYDLEPIYTYNAFNNSEINRMTFTFDRSIKRLRIELYANSEEKITRNTYFKDMKFGFSKSAFLKELEEKKENEEEIEYLKALGIYVDDFYSLVALDEDGNEIEEEEETEEDDSLYDENDGYIYRSDDETVSYDDIVRDRNSGPAFDESLQNEHTWRDSGPAFIKEGISTNSNIK